MTNPTTEARDALLPVTNAEFGAFVDNAFRNWNLDKITADEAAGVRGALDALIRSRTPTALPAADSGWRDIASAPKDGTEIIICYVPPNRKLRGVSRARWVTADFWADLDGPGADPADFEAGWYEPDAEDELCATHWMPLPTAPERAS